MFTIRNPLVRGQGIERSWSWDPQNFFTFLNQQYGYGGFSQTLRGDTEPIDPTFSGWVQQVYKANPIVAACIDVRMHLFSEARFQFRRLRTGRPGDLFGNPDLESLEKPWSGGTTGDLLARMEQDYSLSGNYFGLSTSAGIDRLRPDWTDIILGSRMENATWDPQSELIGYAYTPGGRGSGEDPIIYRPELVVHYAPKPDPEMKFRGLSWLQAVIDEVMADKAATSFKQKFFEGGGQPNILVEFDKDVVKTMAEFDKWVEAMKAQLGNMGNQHRALFLAAGTKGTVTGSTLEQIQFKDTQGAGETRIASAAGVPPVIVGFSEGLQGSALNAGNYAVSMRRFVDLTMRPLWRNAAGSLAHIINVPSDAELWYDDRDIPALREGETDAAAIVQTNMATIGQAVKDGFTPESAIKAVLAGDLDLLKHTGLLSVQLHDPTAPPPEPTNGQIPEPDIAALQAGKE
jgi:hypothetical protein